jgi:hypothetical protein
MQLFDFKREIYMVPGRASNFADKTFENSYLGDAAR